MSCHLNLSCKQTSMKTSMKTTHMKTRAAGNPSHIRRCAGYFHSSTSGLVSKWLYDHYMQLMNNCVP